MEEAKARFEEKGGVARASALINAALVLGQDDEDLQIPRALLIESGKAPLHQDLVKYLDERGSRMLLNPAGELIQRGHDRRRISTLRGILKQEPRNALRWIDLALELAIRGDKEGASRACLVAVELTPNNRFVLRSAARCWQHSGDLERARAIIDRSPLTPVDPWLLAASLAIADLASKSSQHLRAAKNMLSASDMSPWHLSELGGALSTIEWRHGSDRKARQLMRQALKEPTENVLAQAEWAHDRGLMEFDEDSSTAPVPCQFEADARREAYEFDWRHATDSAWLWMEDQPFSAEPALFGSWTACQQDDYQQSLDFCDRGRTANPENPWLANNTAYALAKAGKPDEAEPWIKQARLMHPDSRQQAYLTATEGLVKFRQGHLQQARQRYEEAISHLLAQQRRDEATAGKLILAEEELIAGTEMALQAFARAESAAKNSKSRTVLARWLRLKALAGEFTLASVE